MTFLVNPVEYYSDGRIKKFQLLSKLVLSSNFQDALNVDSLYKSSFGLFQGSNTDLWSVPTWTEPIGYTPTYSGGITTVNVP